VGPRHVLQLWATMEDKTAWRCRKFCRWFWRARVSFENNWRLVCGQVTYCFSISAIRCSDCIMRQMNIATRCMDPFNLNKASQQLASLCQRSETHIPETESYQAALNRCCQHLNNKTLNFTSSITCHVKPSQLDSFRFSFCPNNKECLITKCNVLISIRSQLSIKPTLPFRLPRTVATLSIKKNIRASIFTAFQWILVTCFYF
jgi:hypothetical protein